MDKQFICKICDKKYKSKSSICNHNKKFHSSESTESQHFVAKSKHLLAESKHLVNSETDAPEKVYACEYCYKEFSFKQSKSRHMKNCKKINDLKIDKYEKDIAELKAQIKELLNKKCKIHYKTLQKLNNSGNMNNGNLNNGTVNNTVNIMALGQENINDVLTKTEKMKILNQKANALPFMIEYVHFNDKFPQFKNIAITNSRNNYAHLYDDTLKTFKLIDKNELIDDLIDYRVCDIEEYYFNYVDELVEPVKKKIEELLENRGDNDHTKEKIKLLLFNNKHKIDIKTLTIDQ